MVKLGDKKAEYQMPTFTTSPDCGYEIKVKVSNLPDGVTYKDDKLIFEVKKKESVGGY